LSQFSIDAILACFRPNSWCKLGLLIDFAVLRFALLGLTGWLERLERDTIAYLAVENL
jgi:hypothetical protein